MECALHEADGLLLAEDLRADRDYPPFDKALMDGFAVRCGDLEQLPADLTVIGTVAAGVANLEVIDREGMVAREVSITVVPPTCTISMAWEIAAALPTVAKA